ncbi:MAG: aminotransferase class I/II-fold pyridoxal phosphate-dependent enzyme [Candidatus Zixiibacteriota bacterium]
MAKISNIKPASRTADIRYAVRDIVVLAKEVAKTRKELLYLNIGDPNQYDFVTPPHMVEAIHRALTSNFNGYSPSSGIQEAVDAIDREARRKGIDNILDLFVTTGASEAIEICLTALADEGDNVMTPAPGYPLYQAVLAKLKVVENAYYLNEDDDWQPDLDDISSKINSRTRAIVMINPNNPTGSVCSEETMRGLIKLVKEHNLVIFCDEIYDKLILNDKKHISLASLDRNVSCITFNGLSKSYLGPGLRIGWGIVSGDGAVMKDYIEAINKILRARLCANHPIQYAIKPALEGDQSHLDIVRDKLRRRRDITTDMLNDIPGMSCVKPEGAFYAFPRIYIDQSDEHFVKELIKETGVVVVPGSGFGQAPDSRHFRVVFLPPEDILKKAYSSIAEFFKKYVADHENVTA